MRFAQEISIFNPYAIEMAVTELGTRITQTAEEIKAEAAKTLSNYSTTVQMNAAITAKANEITSEVSETYATRGSVSSLSSRIEQTATAISFTLSKSDERTASLSMTYTKENGSKVSLAAQEIEFAGLVRFTDLSTSGSTEINGNNITTGKIKDTNSNTVFDLSTGTLTMKKGSINLGDGVFSVTNAGKLTASDIYINAPLGSTGSRVYAYDIGGTRLNMGDGSNSNATFFANTTTRVIRTTPYIQFINATGGVLSTLELDGDTTGNPNTRRMLFTNGLKISSTYGEWFLCKSYAQFDGGVGDGSDRRMKQGIKPLVEESAVNTILSLKPVQYAYKSDPEYIHHGFIAQDVQEIVHDWDVVRAGENGMLGLSYNDFIADIVATIQYQNRRIEELERYVWHINH